MGNITSAVIPQDCYIYSHHFPLSLLEWRKNNPTTYLTIPLSRNLTSGISIKKLCYISLTDATNSVFHIHNQRLSKVDRSRKMIGNSHPKWFVQSPMITRDEIYSLSKSIKYGIRTKRMYTYKESSSVKKRSTRKSKLLR